MKVDIECDVFIAGGGLAGLIATLASAGQGLGVACCDPVQTLRSQDKTKHGDNRITALFDPSIRFCETLGLSPFFAQHGRPFSELEVVDDNPDGPRTTLFKAHEIDLDRFGVFVQNSALRHSLLSRIADTANVQVFDKTRVVDARSRTDRMFLTLSNGKSVSTKLLIAADGRKSPIRTILGIKSQTVDFIQNIASFDVSHPVKHENKAIEIHARGGPFTFIPHPGYPGETMSSVVWMDDPQECLKLKGMNSKKLAKRATERSLGRLGKLQVHSGIKLWSSQCRLISKLIAERTAFIAEAAHVLPPIGAQGLNLSIGDVESLISVMTQSTDPGETSLLKRYHRQRYPDTIAQLGGVMGLNIFSQARWSPLSGLRRFGLNRIAASPIIKRSIMLKGLGQSSSTRRA